jgi:cyclopropane-fatty-acyl-phospholipid synthase
LSPRQAEWITSYDLPQIEVRVESWSDHVPEAPYDAITSMGAFEHFARPLMSEEERVRGYRSFFQCCHDWLNPGGWISLETVSYENASREDLSQFFLTEIYPESDLPTLADIAKACERIFEIVRLRNDRLDAAQTWRAWLAGLRNHRAEAVELVGEEMVDHYEKYLKYSIIGNHTGTMGQLRMAMRRIDRPRA